MTRLIKGQNIPLTAGTVRVVVGWTVRPGVPDVDVSALLLGADYKVRSDEDFIFYNQPAHASGSVRHDGKRVEGTGQVDTIVVDTTKVPADVQRVLIGASADGGPFEQVPDLHVRFLDGASGAELARFELSDASTETAFQMGEVYRRGAQWKLRAVGQGYDSGLRALAIDFGVSVDDAEPEVEVEPMTPPPATRAPSAPVTDLYEDGDEEAFEMPDAPFVGLGGVGVSNVSAAPPPAPARPAPPPPARPAPPPPARPAPPPPARPAPPASAPPASAPPAPARPAPPSAPPAPVPAAPVYTLPQIDPNHYGPPPGGPPAAPAAPAAPSYGPPATAPPSSPFPPSYGPPPSAPPAPPAPAELPTAPMQLGPRTGPMPTGPMPTGPMPTGPMPTAPGPNQPPTGPVNLGKQRKLIDMEKRAAAQAPRLLSLTKQAAVSLAKRGLTDHTARVALCLDISGSMSGLYRSGKIQALCERVLALGLRFDDNEQVDVFLFGANAHDVGELGMHNFGAFLGNVLRQYPLEGGTMYGAAMRMIRRQYFGFDGPRQQPVSAQQPVYVMFVTDGATMDHQVTVEQIKSSAFEPIFWQFMAIGNSPKAVDAAPSQKRGFLQRLLTSDFSFLENLDTMRGRFLDNANFFAVNDPANVPDEMLFDLMMTEYPGWLGHARHAGLLPR